MKKQEGFILLEILILLILIGLFLSAMGPSLVSQIQQAHEDNAAEGAKRLVAAEISYQAKFASYATGANAAFLSACNVSRQPLGDAQHACLVSPLLTQATPYHGYLFSIPATAQGYLVAAVPMNQHAGRKVYCGGFGSTNDGLLHSVVGWNTAIASADACNSLPYAEDTDQGSPGAPCPPTNPQCVGPSGGIGATGATGPASTVPGPVGPASTVPGPIGPPGITTTIVQSVPANVSSVSNTTVAPLFGVCTNSDINGAYTGPVAYSCNRVGSTAYGMSNVPVFGGTNFEYETGNAAINWTNGGPPLAIPNAGKYVVTANISAYIAIATTLSCSVKDDSTGAIVLQGSPIIPSSLGAPGGVNLSGVFTASGATTLSMACSGTVASGNGDTIGLSTLSAIQSQ